jgi:hypothetical protein
MFRVPGSCFGTPFDRRPCRSGSLGHAHRVLPPQTDNQRLGPSDPDMVAQDSREYVHLPPPGDAIAPGCRRVERNAGQRPLREGPAGRSQEDPVGTAQVRSMDRAAQDGSSWRRNHPLEVFHLPRAKARNEGTKTRRAKRHRKDASTPRIFWFADEGLTNLTTETCCKASCHAPGRLRSPHTALDSSTTPPAASTCSALR